MGEDESDLGFRAAKRVQMSGDSLPWGEGWGEGERGHRMVAQPPALRHGVDFILALLIRSGGRPDGWEDRQIASDARVKLQNAIRHSAFTPQNRRAYQLLRMKRSWKTTLARIRPRSLGLGIGRKIIQIAAQGPDGGGELDSSFLCCSESSAWDARCCPALSGTTLTGR